MKNIEQYRKRFNSLLESTIGDVRPLISEDNDSKQPPHLRLYNCLKKDGWKITAGSLDSGDKVEYSKFEPTGKSFKCEEGVIEKWIKDNFLKHLGFASGRVIKEGKQKTLICTRTEGVIKCEFMSMNITEENFCANIINKKLEYTKEKFTFDGNGVNLTCDELMMKIK